VETILVACDFLNRAGFHTLPLFPALDPSAYDLSAGELAILPGVITVFGARNLGGIVRSKDYAHENYQQEDVQYSERLKGSCHRYIRKLSFPRIYL
jgi:hypothetical protein